MITAFLQAEAAWTLGAPEPLGAPAGLEFTRRTAEQDGQKAEVLTVTFDTKTHSVAVMDNPTGDFTLATAAQKRNALAAVNGGYFHPDRRPLGLVVRQGATLHPIERAKLLSGMVVVRAGRVSLVRPSEFKTSPAVQEALQAGPFLIDRGQPVAGLNATRAAARTVVFTSGAGRGGFVVCRYVTLAEMAEILALPAAAGSGAITRALNLDGGSSTGLWVRGAPSFYLPEAKDVRNYLAVVPR